MGHIEYPARTERKGGYQHIYYPHAQETAEATPSTSQGQRCWQMPSLCSTSLLKTIRNFFGSGFASAGKNSLLTQQQQAFCECSMGLSLLSPQGQSQWPRSPQGTEHSKPQSSNLACSESWPPHSGACRPLPGTAGALSCSHSASLGHRCPMLLAFAHEMEEESWGLLESTASEGSCPLWGWWQVSMVSLEHGASAAWGKRHGRTTQASVPSVGRLTCRWDRA